MILSKRNTYEYPNYSRVILASISGINNTSTAGDSSILEFSSRFAYLIDQSHFEQLVLFSDIKGLYRIHLTDVVITRDMISFVIIDLFRIVSRRKFLVIYYATDVFSNRLPQEIGWFRRFYVSAAISYIEVQIWKSADYIYANRSDEAQTISRYNQNVILVPAHSRIPNKIELQYPSKEKGLNFIFVGSSGNVPNRQSIQHFTQKYWPRLLKEFPGSVLVVVGGGWDRYVSQSDNVILTGFISEEELEQAYSSANFSVGYLDYGAGVKGKVLEAMEHSTVVVGNDVAFEGIPCEALSPFASVAVLVEQIHHFTDPDRYKETVDEYAKFLGKNYSMDLIEEGICLCIKK